MTTRTLRIGTRASALARWQAQWVAERLVAGGLAVDLVPITTRGDVEASHPVADIGSPGVFTKELQRALLDDRIDLAVHSLKDLPTDRVDGLCLAAVPERESPFDVLISREGVPFDELRQGALVGTGSLRRRAQLLHVRSDLEMRGIRGNVGTRLEKLAGGDFDALVLAHAGLKRLGFEDRITEILSAEVMLPAVGQGALGIEARSDDEEVRTALAMLDDEKTHQAVVAERTLLARLSGGCLAPIGAWARLDEDGRLRLDAVALSADGNRRISASDCLAFDAAEQLGQQVAARMLADGAGALIGEARQSE